MNHPLLPTPVLEIGGTHVTAALVRGPGGAWRVAQDSVVRRELDAHAPAAALLDAIAAAGSDLGAAHSGVWGVALPGPFDYAAGVALYEHVGKFDELKGVDVGAGLAHRLGSAVRHVSFLNDADAFGIGEVALGAAGGSRRAVCITLGTGVGSSFLADGVPVKSGSEVPPDGSCYLLEHGGRPLEDTVSRRAIRRAYAAATAGPGDSGAAGVREPELDGNHDGGTPDVREIAEAARAGDVTAAAVLDHAFGAAGAAAAPYLQRFRAEVLVVGGSMAGSWDIVEPALRRGIASVEPGLARLPLRKAERSEEAGLVGAAYWAMAAGSDV